MKREDFIRLQAKKEQLAGVIVKPRVIFVDGPNGFGKDYLLERLSKGLKDIHHPNKTVDPRWKLPSSIQNKRLYYFHSSSAKEILEILQAHIEHLEEIRKLVSRDPGLIVISNRSFLSAICHNFYHLSQDEINHHTNVYLNKFFELFQNPSNYFPTLHLGLSSFHDLILNEDDPRYEDKRINRYISGIVVRDGGERPSYSYVKELLYRYGIHHRYYDGVDYLEMIHSGQTDDIIEKYFYASSRG